MIGMFRKQFPASYKIKLIFTIQPANVTPRYLSTPRYYPKETKASFSGLIL